MMSKFFLKLIRTLQRIKFWLLVILLLLLSQLLLLSVPLLLMLVQPRPELCDTVPVPCPPVRALRILLCPCPNHPYQCLPNRLHHYSLFFPLPITQLHPFLLPFHPTSPLEDPTDFSSFLARFHHHLIFSNSPLPSFKCTHNLHDLLVCGIFPSSIPPHLEPSLILDLIVTPACSPPTPLSSLDLNSMCTSHSLIYCIRCSLCDNLYIVQTGQQLVDQFTKHLHGVQLQPNTPIAHHFHMTNHSTSNTSVFGLALHHRSTHSRLHLEQRYISVYKLKPLLD